MAQTIVSIPLGRATAYVVKGTRPILVDCGTPGNEERIISKEPRSKLRGIEGQEARCLKVVGPYATVRCSIVLYHR